VTIETLDEQHATEVATFLKTYAYVNCRGLCHPYTTPLNEWVADGSGLSLVWQKTRLCPECGLERIDRMNARFKPLKPLYKYPDGYKSEPGLAISRTDVRIFEIQQAQARHKSASTRAARPAKAAKKPAAPARRATATKKTRSRAAS
jgi:hypothetical protein